MSMYMSFFIKTPKDEFYPIGTYGRGGSIYEGFYDFSAWEKVRPLDEVCLNTIIASARESQDRWRRMVSEDEHKLDMITKMDNSVEEKIEALEEVMNHIKDSKEIIDELDYVCNFANFLKDMIDDADSRKYFDGVENINPGEYIYCGIEIGAPTKDDIA